MVRVRIVTRVLALGSICLISGACSSGGGTGSGGGAAGAGGAGAGGTGAGADGGGGASQGGMGGAAGTTQSAACDVCKKLATSDCDPIIAGGCNASCSEPVVSCKAEYQALTQCQLAADSVSCACGAPVFAGCNSLETAYLTCSYGSPSYCDAAYAPDAGYCGVSCSSYAASCKPEGSAGSCTCSRGPNACKQFSLPTQCAPGSGWEALVAANCAP